MLLGFTLEHLNISCHPHFKTTNRQSFHANNTTSTQLKHTQHTLPKHTLSIRPFFPFEKSLYLFKESKEFKDRKFESQDAILDLPFRLRLRIQTQGLTATSSVYTGISMDCEIFWCIEELVKHDNSMSAASKACQQLYEWSQQA